MAIKNLENPVFHYDDPINGGPAIGWKVNVYAAGTSTRINTWQDSSKSVLNLNPVELDAYGNAKIWFEENAKIVLTQPDDSPTGGFTFDNLSPVGGTSTVTGDYNLVQNGSFEAGSGTDITGWTIALNDPSVTITIDTANVSNGKQALKFDGLSLYGAGTATSVKFDVTANSMLYTYFKYMVSNAVTTNSVQLFWYKKDDTASTTPNTTIFTAASGHPLSYELRSYLTLVPSDATRAEIKITGIDQGGSNLDADAWFDDVFCLDNQGIRVEHSSAPVNGIKVSTANTGANPSISSEGEANTGIILADSNDNEIFVGESVASAVNHPTITNASTGNTPSINVGTEDVGISIEGVILHNSDFKDANGNEFLTHTATASAVNHPKAVNSATGNATGFEADGTDTDIDFDITGKGNGRLTTKATPVYGFVVVDPPENVLSTGTPATTATAVNITTLNTANAVKAILHISLTKAETAALPAISTLGVGSSSSVTAAGVYVKLDARVRVLSQVAAEYIEITVNLDVNNDFWYITSQTGTTGTETININLVGYYV